MEKTHITEYKQTIILRTDIKMNRGKLVAQGSHASWIALLNTSRREGDNLIIPIDDRSRAWFDNKFTKVVLAIDSEEELVALHEKAKEKGLLSSLVLDSGLTMFNYVPTLTAVAIGPDKAESINELTKHLKVLN